MKGPLFFSVSPSSEHNNLGYNDISAVHDIGQGIACEAVFTFILVFSVLGCTDEHRPFFGSPALGIGLTVGVLHLALVGPGSSTISILSTLPFVYLTLPHPTPPFATSPYPTQPHLTRPDPTPPHPNITYPPSPYPIPSNITLPNRTLPYPTHPTLPHPTLPYPTQPYPTPLHPIPLHPNLLYLAHRIAIVNSVDLF